VFVLAALVGPNSTCPAPDWSCYTAFANKNECDLYGFLLVASNQATGSLRHPCFDSSGYDLWPRN
jgi:hypothetical protein